MKALSWNVRGLGSLVKRAIIKEVIRSLKVELLLLQEAKLSLMPQMAVRELWGNSHCSWASLDAHGSSGIWRHSSLLEQQKKHHDRPIHWCFFSIGNARR